MREELLVSAAVEAGAAKAEVIDAKDIVLSAAFRDICRTNQCGCYGRNWSCPPDMGEVEELMEKVRSYPRALLYQTIGQLEDSFDFEGMLEAGKVLSDVGQKLQDAAKALLKADFLHLSGSCRLCEKCARLTGEPCRHPDRMLPSISGFGINVSATCEPTSLRYINGPDTVTNFGILLFSE